MSEVTALALLLAITALTFWMRRRGLAARGYVYGLQDVLHDLTAGFKPPRTRQRQVQPVAGGGATQPSPPDFEAVLQELAQEPSYTFPIGYEQAGLVSACFVGDVNHILITGTTGSGKDNLATGILLSLAMLNPDEVALCIIDGKGLDFAAWQGRGVVWRAALLPEDIAPTLEALTQERHRRGELLRAAGVSRWEDYTGGDLPLLVVYVSELSLLADALGGAAKLEAWLNPELAAARAFGIRFIVATQTVSGMATRWRSQVGLYLAGLQVATSQDEPNTGLPAPAIKAAGDVPPSELPDQAGWFTAVQGREVATVRAAYVPANLVAALLRALPAAPPAAAGAGAGSISITPASAGVGLVSGDTTGNTDTDTTRDTTSKAARKQRQRIAEALSAGLSITAVAELIGGNRNAAFTLVREVAAELAENERGRDEQAAQG